MFSSQKAQSILNSYVMLARPAQTLVLLLVLISTIPLASFNADSPAFASMGLLAVFLAFAGLMSTQFIIMVWVNRRRAAFPSTAYRLCGPV